MKVRGFDTVNIAALDESLSDMAVNTWNSFDEDTKALVTLPTLLSHYPQLIS